MRVIDREHLLNWKSIKVQFNNESLIFCPHKKKSSKNSMFDFNKGSQKSSMNRDFVQLWRNIQKDIFENDAL